jgi:hypothetical protein
MWSILDDSAQFYYQTTSNSWFIAFNFQRHDENGSRIDGEKKYRQELRV